MPDIPEVPELYVDLVARWIPGTVLLVSAPHVAGSSLAEVFLAVLGSSPGEPALPAGLVTSMGIVLFVLAGFVLGHLLGPVVWAIEQVWSRRSVLARMASSNLEDAEFEGVDRYGQARCRAILALVREDDRESPKRIWGYYYDWLMAIPEQVPRLTKLLSLSRMSMGLLAVSLVCLLVLSVRTAVPDSRAGAALWGVWIGAGVVSALATWRSTLNFQRAVLNLRE